MMPQAMLIIQINQSKLIYTGKFGYRKCANLYGKKRNNPELYDKNTHVFLNFTK